VYKAEKISSAVPEKGKKAVEMISETQSSMRGEGQADRIVDILCHP